MLIRVATPPTRSRPREGSDQQAGHSPRAQIRADLYRNRQYTPAGERYGDILSSVMNEDDQSAGVDGGDAIGRDYDRAVHLELPSGLADHGRAGARSFWGSLRACFPDATFEIHHQIGRDDPGLGERAALRWSLHGSHDGGERYGKPTGAEIHVMGLSHSEFGPEGVRREYVLIDDTAIWKQILMA